MKKFILFILLFAVLKSYAQTDTSKVEQYCELLATGRLLSNKVTIDINYGEFRSIWKDHRLKSDEGKLQKFNSVTDALNYLGRDGWKLVNAFAMNTGGQNVYHFFFKKEFLKAESIESGDPASN